MEHGRGAKAKEPAQCNPIGSYVPSECAILRPFWESWTTEPCAGRSLAPAEPEGSAYPIKKQKPPAPTALKERKMRNEKIRFRGSYQV